MQDSLFSPDVAPSLGPYTHSEGLLRLSATGITIIEVSLASSYDQWRKVELTASVAQRVKALDSGPWSPFRILTEPVGWGGSYSGDKE